jgi:very-short-patch-repair endonuclease
MTESDAAGMREASESHGLIQRERVLEYLRPRQLKRRLRDGVLVKALPRVYRWLGAPQTWLQSLEGLLLWDQRLVFSHRTAAALHGFELFKEGPLEVITTKKIRKPDGVTVHRAKVVPRSDRTEVDDLPVTNVPRTLIDLMASTDWYTVKTTIDQALREKKTTLEELQAAARRAKRRPGVIEFRALLREFSGEGGPTDSELEDLCLDLIQDAGLPRPKVQKRVVAGGKRRRLDLLYEEFGVVIEADGYASHSGIEIFEDDRQRNNSLVAANIRVLHWTWQAINDRPEDLIAELYAVLNRHH